MKRKGKIISALLLVLVCCGILINIVLASSYYSSLEMDTATLKGSTRYYTAGPNKFFIKPTKLTPQEAGEYVQLRVQLNEDTGSMCVLVGTRYIDMYKANLGQTYEENFGYLSAGNKYYYFTTNHDNVDWGYIYAKQGNVLMTSDSGKEL